VSARNRRRRRTPTDDNAQSLAERIQAEREKLFGAAGIVDCCIYACDSKLAPKHGRPNLLAALEAVHEVIDCTASELGQFCDELRASQRATQRNGDS
jgi:hypothetical protein